MAAVGFSFPTIDARSSPIFQISGCGGLVTQATFHMLRAHSFSKKFAGSWRAPVKVNNGGYKRRVLRS